MVLKYVLNQILAYIPCWIRTQILCVGTASVIESRIMLGRMKSVISSENKQACKAIKDHKQEEEKQGQDFICPWMMAEYKGRSSEKSFFSSAFSSLGRMSGCPQLHWNRIISLSEMNSPRKQLLIMRLQIGCSPARPPPRTWDEQLKMCRTKQVFVLLHRRWLLVSFTIPISCCFLSHAACPKVNYIIWKRCQSHSYYSTKDVRFSINTSGQIS